MLTAALALLLATAVATVEMDMQAFIDAKLVAGEKRIVIPPGRYRVAAKQGTHLRFKGLSDIAIVADGVELVATSTCRIAVFEDCTNVSLRGLTVDFDPLPFTQGRITALAPDKSWVEFEILDGYPENDLHERIEIYDPATGRLRRETAGWEPELERLGDRRYRATKRHYRFQPALDTEQVGDILVTNNSFPAKAGGHAFDLGRCRNLLLEDISLYGSNCFGFIEHDCDGSIYRRCRIDRRSPEHDPVPRAVPRMRSLNADAFHSVGAAKGPTIEACTAKFQGDDCVNIHGTYHLITAVDGPRLRIAVLGRPTIEPGDPVEFLPFTGPRPADAVATAIEADPTPITDAEKDRIRPVSMNDRNKQRLLDGNVAFFTLTLDREVSLPPLSTVCSGNRVGNGFVVRGCDFGFNRSRGILIKASRGQVVGNTISHGWMAAVLVAPEYWWFEAASASDVEIRDNTIVGCRRTAIEVVAQGGDGKPLPAGAHRDITITGNRIIDSAWPNIFVTSTSDLSIADNDLTPTETSPFEPPLQRPWRWNGGTPAPIVTEGCEERAPPKP